MKRHKCRRGREGGFTLVELLVVIAVIALLAGMTLPAFGRVKRLGGRILCLNNIRQQVSGALMYAEDDKRGALAGTIDPADSKVYGWLYPAYVSETGVFRCPGTQNVIRVGEEGRNDLRHIAGSRGANGLAHYTFGFMHTGGVFEEGDERFVYHEQLNWGTLKTLSNVQTYWHRNHAFGYRGIIPGPSRIFQVLDADTDWRYYVHPDRNDPHGFGFNVGRVDGHATFVSSKDPMNFVRVYELSGDKGQEQPAPATEGHRFAMLRTW